MVYVFAFFWMFVCVCLRVKVRECLRLRISESACVSLIKIVLNFFVRLFVFNCARVHLMFVSQRASLI